MPAHEKVACGLCMVPEGRQLFPDHSVLENLELGAFHRLRAGEKAAVSGTWWISSNCFRASGNDFPKRRAAVRRRAADGGDRTGPARPPAPADARRAVAGAGAGAGAIDLQSFVTLKNRGIAVLLVEQMAWLGLGICDRAYVLEGGKFLIQGTRDAVRSDARVVEAYLGQVKSRAIVAMTGPEVAIFGCLTPDNVVTATGECLPQTFGGNALYGALGARVWSDRVGMVSRFGDGYPMACFDLLRALNIDIGGVRHLGKPHGRNVAFAYKADGSRTRAFPPEIIERIPRAERSRFIDTSLLPDAMERWHEFAPDESDVPAGWWRSRARHPLRHHAGGKTPADCCRLSAAARILGLDPGRFAFLAGRHSRPKTSTIFLPPSTRCFRAKPMSRAFAPTGSAG